MLNFFLKQMIFFHDRQRLPESLNILPLLLTVSVFTSAAALYLSSYFLANDST